MPSSTSPQGFVVCSQCEGLFQARDHTRPTPPKLQAGQLPEARTDVKLVHRIGKEVRTRKVLSKNEIADLLDGMLPPEAKAARPPPGNAAVLTGRSPRWWRSPC